MKVCMKVIIFSPLPNIEKEFFKASEVIFRTLQRKFSIVKQRSEFWKFSTIVYGRGRQNPNINGFLDRWIVKIWYNIFILNQDQLRLIQYLVPWICIKSSWSNFFFLDFDQLVLILYFFSGFRSSQVDPIFYFWILINSSWFNIFVLDLNQLKLIHFFIFGFWSTRVDPIFLFWIWIKSCWSNFIFLDFNQVELIQYFLNWI